ncbi:MAG: hypothetical protein F6K37_14725 [Moorea sp. SIO4E2]|uniref:hypothetical protein n=1 Tax=Moorena sp. SIO4E2 TaxID=2607826 RepID=UPI0013BB66F5|nr:hypothetical protein [Moorena sp. SIO4E2]NEQ07144.1 hypothetical protein [Moorena sp. SIO4E2]
MRYAHAARTTFKNWPRYCAPWSDVALNVVSLGLIWQIFLFNAIGARVMKGFFTYKRSQ